MSSLSIRFAMALAMGAILVATGCAHPEGTPIPAPATATGNQSSASTGTLTFSLEVTPTAAAVGQVISATTSYRIASDVASLTLVGDSLFFHHILVKAPNGDVVFDSEPSWAKGSPGHVAGIFTLKPGASSSRTTTFSVATPGTYYVIADEQAYDMGADVSYALETPRVPINVQK